MKDALCIFLLIDSLREMSEILHFNSYFRVDKRLQSFRIFENC